MGETQVGPISPASLTLPAPDLNPATLFFAMFGGRGMTDIRDLPHDQVTDVQTLPKRYRVRRTVQFIVVNLHFSYALSLAVWFTGESNVLYLYLHLAMIAAGVVSTWLFAARPSSRLAWLLTPAFLMGQGFLFCLAMILGSL